MPFASRTVIFLNLSLGEAAKRSVGNTPGQIPDMSFFPSFGSENGWTRLPNNMIFQWGFASFAGTGSGLDVGILNYYPIPFPNKCLMMVMSHTGYYPQNAGIISYVGMNNSQFRGYSSVATVETGPVTGAWIAIGI